MHDAVMHARCTWVHNVHRSALVLQNSLKHEPGSGVVSTKQRSPTLELQQKWISQFEESSQARLTAEFNCQAFRSLTNLEKSCPIFLLNTPCKLKSNAILQQVLTKDRAKGCRSILCTRSFQPYSSEIAVSDKTQVDCSQITAGT